jgi:hypothetical protein
MKKFIQTKFKLIGMLLFVTLFMANCNEQVPTGYKGIILGPTGYQNDLYVPGVVDVDNGIFTKKMKEERLLFIQTTSAKYSSPIKVKLTDKMEFGVTIYVTGRISESKKRVIDSIKDLPIPTDGKITNRMIYEMYAKMRIMNTARKLIRVYNIDNVSENYDRITAQLLPAITKILSESAFVVTDVTIGETSFPQIVTDSINRAKEKQMEIDTETSKALIANIKNKAKENKALSDYNIQMLEAKGTRDSNQMISKGISKDLLKLKSLQVQQTIADNLKNNKNVVYMPLPMMNGTTNMRVIK